jgi:hypothetical protein
LRNNYKGVIFATMTTYQQAKDVYNTLGNMADSIIVCDNVPFFRKHLTEFEFRKKEGKKFTTKILDNKQLLVKRIK